MPLKVALLAGYIGTYAWVLTGINNMITHNLIKHNCLRSRAVTSCTRKMYPFYQNLRHHHTFAI